LGGTSLLSVKLFAEIARQMGVPLSLTTILEAPTVRSLARLVALPGAEGRDGMVCLRKGGSSNLFLVHDGLGETLLYLNLARRLPSTLSVYGIEPKRLPGIPLAHASIESMASFYANQIRRVQPRGPYLLGGMCAGGVIAYEIAVYLRKSGESVRMVAILDGATPQAAKRIGRASRIRRARFADAMDQARRASDSIFGRAMAMSGAIIRKARGVLSYEMGAAANRISVRLRFAVMKYLVKRGQAWPAYLPGLSVMQIYNLLESRYRPSVLVDVPVVLVRASTGDGADTPYRELYRDEDLGWRRVAHQLELVDVRGGHSSMLQDHEIESLASAMVERLQAQSVVDMAVGQ
jgi:thioesterase domain-containing protein